MQHPFIMMALLHSPAVQTRNGQFPHFVQEALHLRRHTGHLDLRSPAAAEGVVDVQSLSLRF